jgi:small redox-active disulfide protein 2
MKKLQILGTGCAKCQQLTLHTEQAAQAMGIDSELEKVTEIDQIMNFGVMMTPALVVDGTVKVIGRVPSVEQLKQVLA